MIYIKYKSPLEFKNNDLARKKFNDEIQVEAQDEEEEDENIFWQIPQNIDEFNLQSKKQHIKALKNLSKNIERAYSRNEVIETQDFFIDAQIPELIINIFQETLSVMVLQYTCNVIDKWIHYQFDPNVWFTVELLPSILVFATPITAKMNQITFEHSVNILNNLLYKKKNEFLTVCPLRKIIIRIVNSFKKNLFPSSRGLLTQFLDSIFINITDFDVNDVLILGDIFNLLPDCESSPYFINLMKCALSLCEKSQEFAYSFVENVNVCSIFSQIAEIPNESRFPIIEMMNFFLDTNDQTLINSFISDFEWSWIIPILKEPDDFIHSDLNLSNIKESASYLAVNFIVTIPELADLEGAKDIIEYFCEFINNDDYIGKLAIFKCTTKLFSIGNPNINNLLIENSYIEIAADYLSSAEGDVITCIIDSIHYIAQYAENFGIQLIIDRLANADLIELIIDKAQSDDKKISESAIALLNDKCLTLFQSYLQDPQET